MHLSCKVVRKIYFFIQCVDCVHHSVPCKCLGEWERGHWCVPSNQNFETCKIHKLVTTTLCHCCSRPIQSFPRFSRKLLIFISWIGWLHPISPYLNLDILLDLQSSQGMFHPKENSCLAWWHLTINWLQKRRKGCFISMIPEFTQKIKKFHWRSRLRLCRCVLHLIELVLKVCCLLLRGFQQ